MPKTFVVEPPPEKPVDLAPYAAALNEEQLAVVTGGEGPCLVLAGAGSGKTRTVTYRVAYLLARGVAPSDILLLTFTNKAASEMVKRVTELIGTYPKGLTAGTFHAIGNRFLRQYATKIGYASNFTILDAEDSRDVIKIAVKDLSIDTSAKRFPAASVLADTISFSRNTRRPIGEVLDLKYPAWLPMEEQVKDVAALYAKKKREANAMDFDDLLEQWATLMEKHPEVREALSGQYRYVLVDEYQDTNALQSAIVDALVSVHGNLLVVGDDAQSIYAFRGANIENILDFEKRFPKAKIFRLETNYRSTPQILELANEVIAHNERQFPKALKAVHKPFVKPVLAPAASAEQEAAFVAAMLLALEKEGLEQKNMCVLFRATHHSQALEFELVRRGIPYEYRGGMKFFERGHIKDAVGFLRLLQNPRDQIAWMRTLSMFTGIGSTTAGRIADRASSLESLAHIGGLNVHDLLTPKSSVGWAEAVDLLSLVGAAKRPDEAIRALIKSSYADYLEQEHPNWRDRLEDLEQFAVFAEKSESVEDFLNDVALKDDFAAKRAREEQGKEDKLVLSTVHQSKGLEWEVVFVIHLTDQGFPHPRAQLEENGIEEERRLFYVAVTRARRQLFLSYPAVAGHDAMTLMHPSPFLSEVPESCIETINVRARPPVEAGYEEPAIEIEESGPKKNGGILGRRPERGDFTSPSRRNKGFLRDVSEL